MSKLRPTASIALWFFVVPVASIEPAAAQIRPDQMRGTWEQVSTRNLETGVLENIGETRATWLKFTGSIASQIWMTRERLVVQPAELRRLSAERQKEANYAKIWDAEGNPQFSALAGFYRLDGSMMYFTLILNLQPTSTNGSGIDTIVQLDDRTLAYRTGRTPEGGWSREQTYRRVDRASAPGRAIGMTFDPQHLIGTWQTTQTRNLTTGAVERLPATKTAWFQISDSTWTYVTMNKDRPIVTQQQFAGMSQPDRMAANYAKIWDERGQNRFWGSAGTYRLHNDSITFVRRTISLEPWMVKVNEVTEMIVRLDRGAYVTRSKPDSNGVVREFVSRRVD